MDCGIPGWVQVSMDVWDKITALSKAEPDQPYNSEMVTRLIDRAYKASHLTAPAGTPARSSNKASDD